MFSACDFTNFLQATFSSFISFWHNFRFRWLHALHIWIFAGRSMIRQFHDFFFWFLFSQFQQIEIHFTFKNLSNWCRHKYDPSISRFFLARFLTFSPTVRRGGGSGARGLHSQTLATCWIAVLGWGHCYCRGCCRGCCSWGQCCCCLVWRPSI